jgi:hypothetical protein
LSLRYADVEVERAQWRSTVMRRLLPRFAIGLEWNLAVSELGPLATVFLRRESARGPALSLSTSSDRIGSPEGKASYYLTAHRNVPRLPVSVYASLNWSEWDERFNLPFGADLALHRNLSLRPMYDGERTHFVTTWTQDRYSASLLWLWLEEFGLAFSVGLGSAP